jgi:hypothetical protein
MVENNWLILQSQSKTASIQMRLARPSKVETTIAKDTIDSEPDGQP